MLLNEKHTEEDGTVRASIQDSINEIVSLRICNKIADIVLSAPVVLGASVINLVTGHGVVNGNVICLKQDTRYFQATVLNVATNVITLDSPVDYAFGVQAVAFRSSAEMNVNGNTTPVVFAVTPPAGTKWHIRGMDLALLDNVAMDDSTFGGLTALTKGIVVRKRDGDYRTFFNIKANGEFALRATSFEYSAKAPAGSYGLNVEFDFTGHFGAVVQLDADAGEYLEIVIQDDLLALTSFRATVSGHVVK